MRQEKKDCCKETANLLYERSFLYGVIRGGVIMLVSEIMTKDVITVQPNASIREIAECLVEKRISGVPVVDGDGRVVGIVSEGDLMRKEIAPDLPDGLCILGAVIYYNGLREYREAFRKMAAQTARHIMTKEVVSVHAECHTGCENHVRQARKACSCARWSRHAHRYRESPRYCQNVSLR